MGGDVEEDQQRRDRRQEAVHSAAAHERPLTPGIEFTENDPDLALLYGDLRRGQLNMRSLWGAWRRRLLIGSLPTP